MKHGSLAAGGSRSSDLKFKELRGLLTRSDGHDVGDAEEDGERRRDGERTPGGPSHDGYPGEVPGTPGSAFTTGRADAWPHSHRTPFLSLPFPLLFFVLSASLYLSFSFTRALLRRERERGVTEARTLHANIYVSTRILSASALPSDFPNEELRICPARE